MISEVSQGGEIERADGCMSSEVCRLTQEAVSRI
jgi:hypothetical protein